MKDSFYTLKDYGKATIQLKQIIDMKKLVEINYII